MGHRHTKPLSRRAFLSRAGAASSLLFFPRIASSAVRRIAGYNPVRLKGRVTSDGRGVAGVRVSDGLEIATTGQDGAYTLIGNASNRFVWISVPDGYQIPTSKKGTARFYALVPQVGDEAEISFELKQTPNAQNHAFLVLADPQTQDDFEMNRLHTETVPDVLQTLKGLSGRETFGVACGDIMYDRLMLYPRYEEAVSKMNAPFFQVVGNHDLDHLPTDEDSVTTFCRYFGPRYYSFDRGEVHYVVLDNVFWYGDGYMGYLDGTQLSWLARDLQTVEAGASIVVFTHVPLKSSQYRRFGKAKPTLETSVSNREELYRLLEPFRVHIMTGHTHEQEHIFEAGTHEHVHGAVCGAWWSADICFDGTPNGYGVYEVRGSEITWRYKATGKPFEHQIRAYARGSNPDAPEEIVANVWGWDPKWSVFWYVNGEHKGMMSRHLGTDPLSEQLFRGPDLPKHRPWVEPIPTDHLFYCPAPANEDHVRIEAVDPWGNTYVADAPET